MKMTYRMHEGQNHILANRRRYNVVACGRRFGKSRLAYAVAMECIAGKLPVSYWTPTATDYEKRWDEFVKTHRGAIINLRTKDGIIVFRNGSEMHWFGLHRYDGGRGNKYARVIIDEAAHSDNLADAWAEVIRPTLTDYKGDAWLLSTPNWRQKDQSFKRFCNTVRDDYAVFRMPSTANPYIDPAEIEDARNDPNMPSVIFRQEYLAEDVELQGALVNREDIRYGHPAEGERIEYNLGVDLAISTKEGADYTAIAVVGKVENRYYIVDVLRRQMGFNDTKTAIKKMAAKWQPTFVNIEAVQYQAAIVEDLKMEMREYYVNAIHPDRDKRSRFLPTLGKYEHGLVYHSATLPPEFEGELLQFPEGDHDDMVDAVVYAMKGFDSGVRVYNI